MATLIQPPKPADEVENVVGSLFLAGSISLGKTEDWQNKVWESIKDIPSLGVLNPRRDNWNDKCEQKIDNPEFKAQVDWELDGLENVDMVVFYFDPKTESPITMIELGLLSHTFTNWNPKTVVCCPNGFWRKGNVDIMCKRYGHHMVETLDDLIEEIKKEFDYLNKLDKDFDSKSCKMGWNRG